MNQYFFKMSKAERENILDKHKTVYDGYVTEYGKVNNEQPLYVQDLANDKNGITVSNKGDVKQYTNVNINEGHTGLDKIADGPHDLKNGTVDFRGRPDMSDINREYFKDEYPSPNEDEEDYLSVGLTFDGDMTEEYTEEETTEEPVIDDVNFEDDIVERDYFYSEPMNELEDQIDEDELPGFMDSLNESLDMFRRIIK